MAPAPDPSPLDGDDSDSAYDKAMLFVALAFTVPFVAANIAIIYHRKKNYFRALGGVDLLIGTSLAGIVWIVVNFVTNQHFQRTGIMKVCLLWTFWLQLPLGCCLWMMFIFLRLYRLYVLTTKDQQLSRLKTWFIYLPLLLLPALIFSAIGTSQNASREASKRELDLIVCTIFDQSWKYATYLTVPPLYISLIIILLYRLQKQTDFLLMSEHRHTCESTMMAFMFYLLDAVIFISEKQEDIAGRCFLTFCVCWLVFVDFWVRMWKPVYLCIFKSESEMKKFEDELRWCGAGYFDKANVTSVLFYPSRSISIPSSQLHDGDWILRTMDLLFSEIAEREERIHLLEQDKSRLSLKIKELEESLGFLGSSLPENG